MRIGIISCEVFKSELEKLIKDDPDIVYAEFLEFALHVEAQDLVNTIKEKVEALKDKVDAVLICYGYCKVLHGIENKVSVPSVLLQAEDCIGVFLTPHVYAEEKIKNPGTWFMSPYWAKLGVDAVIKELHINEVSLKRNLDPMYLVRMFFDGYTRAMFIDTEIDERDFYEEKAKEFANLFDFQFESRDGTLLMLEKALKQVKELAREQSKKELLVSEKVSEIT
jgi:hypothetical protein